ncbi:MAG: hypothetical protein J3R72DRAFT_446270, partial [Linnemannia gamsii]
PLMRPYHQDSTGTGENSLRGGFRWTLHDREDFVEFLQRRQLDARRCSTEADVAIAADCQPQYIALTQVSDFFAYDSVKTIWRPVGKWDEVKVLEYSRAAVLAQIGLCTTKLTALACVPSNDYYKNIPSMGIATNYRIIKAARRRGISTPHMVCNNQEGIDFPASTLVFTTMTQEIAVTADVSSVPLPSLQSTTPVTSSPASSLSYELLCQQYKAVKDQHSRAKEQRRLNITSNAEPNRQGKHKRFRRHHVIDRPAHQPGVSNQAHRPRYSVKSRPEPQQHEQPSICRQYQRKPYTAEQEARYQQSVTEAKERKAEKQQQREARRLEKAKKLAKKPPLKIDDMNKCQLVNSMVYEHPLVALPVGTAKANSKRAAAVATTNANRLPSSEQQQRQQQQEVADFRMTKRHAQEFLGDFIETVFERGLTENDRTILNSCVLPSSPRSASSSSSAGTPAEDEGEGDAEDDGDEDDDDEDGGDEDDGDEDAEPSARDKPFIAFYQIILARFFTRKIKFETIAERQVSQLLERATSLGITLPPVPPRTISYPTNGLLESTTKQLYQSIKTMYRNGSVALEKKVV